MNDIQNIMSKIQILAKRNKIPIKLICEKINISESGLYYTIKNNTLKVETLLKICEVLEVDMNYFFSDSSPSGSKEKIEALEETILDLKDENYEKQRQIDLFKIARYRTTFFIIYMLLKNYNKDIVNSLVDSEYIKYCLDRELLNELFEKGIKPIVDMDKKASTDGLHSEREVRYHIKGYRINELYKSLEAILREYKKTKI